MADERVVGIDLGTTNSLVAYMETGRDAGGDSRRGRGAAGAVGGGVDG